MNPAQRVRRQVGLLATCQGLLISNAGLLIAINALAGLSIAPNPAYATLPVTSYVLGSALSTVPASLAMRHIGRRAGFTVGGVFCVLGSLLCVLAMSLHSLALLCVGALLIGVYNAFGQYYRFAAAEVTEQNDPAFKEKAISLVLAGGILGGVLGPEASKITKDLFDVPFMGGYLALIGFAVISMLIVTRLDIPVMSATQRAETQRPLAEIMRQPGFIVAVYGTMAAFGIMNLLMTATPLAMNVCGFPFSDAAFVLQWHIFGMFAPGFFTGHLIRRFGVLTIMLTGCAIMMLCAGIAIHGVSLPHFWWSLMLLGVGWNFIFTSATTLLTRTYHPAEKGKVQGINDFLMFAAMITSSFSSGVMFSSSGWSMLNLLAFPVLAVLVGAIFWLARRQRSFA